MSNYLKPEKLAVLLRALGKGVPLRQIAHILDVAEGTVSRYVGLAGEMAIDFLNVQQRDLSFSRVEVDEFYSYVAAKKDNVGRMKKPVEGAGQVLHFMSVPPRTAFIINYLIAPTNDYHHTRIFIRDLASRLKRDENGQFIVKPTILSDGHGSYEPAIEDELGDSVNYWKLNKQHTTTTPDGKKTRRRFDGVFRETPIGDSTDEEFWTNNIESANRTARCQNRRVAKRSNAFSKRADPHHHQFAFWIFYHNYCDAPKRRGVTPAMEVGVTKRFFDTNDIMKLMSRYQRRAKEEGLLEPDEEVAMEAAPSEPVTAIPNDAPFWLYQNLDQNTVKVHRADCCNCRNGAGRGGVKGRSGLWLPAPSLETAMARAEELEPGRVFVCNMCIGERRRLGRRI